jgi:hypothetical protein
MDADLPPSALGTLSLRTTPPPSLSPRAATLSRGGCAPRPPPSPAIAATAAAAEGHGMAQLSIDALARPGTPVVDRVWRQTVNS